MDDDDDGNDEACFLTIDSALDSMGISSFYFLYSLSGSSRGTGIEIHDDRRQKSTRSPLPFDL